MTTDITTWVAIQLQEIDDGAKYYSVGTYKPFALNIVTEVQKDVLKGKEHLEYAIPVHPDDV